MERQRDDQAESLRHQMSKKTNKHDVMTLPSRKEVHRNRKNKKSTFRLSFPLVRLLLMVFLLIVLLLILSPYWLNL